MDNNDAQRDVPKFLEDRSGVSQHKGNEQGKQSDSIAGVANPNPGTAVNTDGTYLLRSWWSRHQIVAHRLKNNGAEEDKVVNHQTVNQRIGLKPLIVKQIPAKKNESRGNKKAVKRVRPNGA